MTLSLMKVNLMMCMITDIDPDKKTYAFLMLPTNIGSRVNLIKVMILVIKRHSAYSTLIP